MSLESMYNVHEKIAIVTGASRGLGKGTAEALAAAGINTVVCDVRPEVSETLASIQRENPENKGFSAIVDVSDEHQVKRLVEDVVHRLGGLDIMVNNAGMHVHEGPVADLPKETVDKLFAVNFYGEFFGCKYAARQMMKQKSGSIINLGSYGGKVGFPGYAAYCASKGAVHTLTTALAREMAPYNVNVNALCPGLAASEMHWSFMKAEAESRGITFEQLQNEELKTIPLGRYGEGRDSAGAIIWLASEAGSYVTGQLININGGLYFA
jgi:NAD(P)-dependent dehydrogenase (short-subunit alcohol dehydrogenase family)